MSVGAYPVRRARGNPDGESGLPALPDAYELVAASKFTTQYSRPQAVYRNGATYYGWTAGDGSTGITKYVHADNSSTAFTLSAATGLPNGHNSCAISFAADGRVIAVWSVHNSTCRVRISTSAEDISAWGSSVTLSGVPVASYANIAYLSTPGEWYVFWRSGQGGSGVDQPCVARASSDLATWDTQRSWILQPTQRPYIMWATNGTNRLDFFFTSRHQTDSAPGIPFGLYHAYMIVDAEGVEEWFTTAGVSLGSGPIEPTTEATLIYDGSTVPAWNWDVAYGADGHPRVLWMKMTGNDDHRHQFSRWNGSSWLTTEIAASGARLYSSETWSDAALCFDQVNTDVIYRGAWVGSAVELQQWSTTDNGSTWAKQRDITSGSSAGVKNFMPYAPRSNNGDSAVCWMSGTITNWDSFSLSIRSVAAWNRG